MDSGKIVDYHQIDESGYDNPELSPIVLRQPDAYSNSQEEELEDEDVELSQEENIIDDEGSFVAEFSDGYSFRNLIEYLRATNTEGNFIFDQETIRYEQSDATDSTLNQIEIQACELTQYEIHSTSGRLVIGVNITDVRSITKTIGKKDGVRIYKKPKDPLIYIQIMNQNIRGTARTNVSVVRPHNVKLTQYTFPTYQNDEKHPNVTVPSSDFSKMCTSMSSVKCDTITIHGKPKGAIFSAMMGDSFVGRIEKIGVCDQIEKQQSLETSIRGKPKVLIRVNQTTPPTSNLVTNDPIINVKSSTIKALTKLNNLSPSGTIKIYMECGSPMKLICRIGTYGQLRIYIRTNEKC